LDQRSELDTCRRPQRLQYGLHHQQQHVSSIARRKRHRCLAEPGRRPRYADSDQQRE
jgi:hypothetical protein